MRRATLLIPVAIVALVVLLSSIFIVDEREKALVIQFGQIQRVKEEPGLAFKIPFIQQVVRYDDRILSLETDPIEVTPSDDRRLIVDAFARYRIADVVQFREAVGVGGESAAEGRIGDILRAQVRAVLGADGVTSNSILSADRAELMARIRDASRSRAETLGLQIVDVRLKQTALPQQNLAATFARMQAEREREAADEIARGEEAAQRVRALADRTMVELVSEATREGEITRGEADAERSGIFAEAFGGDPEFFEFYRSLSAYRTALQQEGTTMVMAPDSEFFDYFKTDGLAEDGSVASGADGDGPAPVAQPSLGDEGAAPDAAAEGDGAALLDLPAEPADEGLPSPTATDETAPAEEAGAAATVVRVPVQSAPEAPTPSRPASATSPTTDGEALADDGVTIINTAED